MSSNTIDYPTLLLLNPELVADSNLTSVAQAEAAWLAAGPDGGSLGQLARTVPVTPTGFDPRVFLAGRPDVSGLNDTIRRAMLGVGLTAQAIERRGTFVATINEDVLLRQWDAAARTVTFGLVNPSSLQLGDSNVREGDLVWLQRRCRGDTVHARVTAVAPEGDAFDATLLQSSLRDAVVDQTVYSLAGIRVWDCERQALVEYSRLGPPPSPDPDDVVPRGDFCMSMYHSVYPDTRTLGYHDTYLDYRARWKRNSEYRIIKGADIFNLAAPYTSNLLSGSGSVSPSSNYGGYLTVSPCNLTAGGTLLRASGSNLLTMAGGQLAVHNGAALGSPLLDAASGSVVVTHGGDLVAGGSASNLAVLQAASVVTMGGGMLRVSGSNATVASRLGVGMECMGDESARTDTTGTASTTRLAVAGDIYATGTLVTLSDERVKVELSDIHDALVRVGMLRGYTYAIAGDSSGRRHTGLLAQDVARALPEATYATPTPEGYISVAYGNMAGLLVQAVNELAQRVRVLERRERHQSPDPDYS